MMSKVEVVSRVAASAPVIAPHTDSAASCRGVPFHRAQALSRGGSGKSEHCRMFKVMNIRTSKLDAIVEM